MNFQAKYFEYTQDEMQELFTRLYPRLCLYVNGIFRRKDAADDIVQEVFCKLLRQRPRLTREKVAAYVFSMAHNECIDSLRREKIFFNSVDLNSASDYKVWEELAMRDFLDVSNDSPIAGLVIEEVLAFCDCLPAQTERIFRMSRIEGMTNVEIARKLGIAQRTVEKHITLSIRRFRALSLYRKR